MKIVVVVVLVLLALGCKKDETPGPVNGLNLVIDYSVDGQPLLFDSLMYVSPAGETYQVTRLEYYLSGFRFYRGGEVAYSSDTVVYIDARKPEAMGLFKQVPVGHYDSLVFFLGVAPEWNHNGMLEPTAENVAMEWPEVMGGGYHFVKLEGHWDEGLTLRGFAIHLGTDPLLVRAGIWETIHIPHHDPELRLNMNINEWFRNPETYSFEQDGVYTRGNMMLMKKVLANASDVFTLKTD